MPSELVLHQHPFASYCQKALVAFYELDVPFTSHVVTDAASRRELAKLWPMAKIPVLRDETAGLTIPESTTIIEYIDALAAGGPQLVPADPAEALQVRLWDRFLDGFVATPMQKIVGDSLRAPGTDDPTGVAEARATLDEAYAALDGQVADRAWVAGDTFSLADCGAAPALFYARVVHAWDDAAWPQLTRYYRDLMHRPSVDRVIAEAQPGRAVFPLPWPPHTDDHRPVAV